jgi:hypothetical protein
LFVLAVLALLVGLPAAASPPLLKILPNPLCLVLPVAVLSRLASLFLRLISAFSLFESSSLVCHLPVAKNSLPGSMKSTRNRYLMASKPRMPEAFLLLELMMK